jgi:hypothetical protein
MKNVSERCCRENQNTHFVFSDFFLKIMPFMRKCEKEWGRPQTTIWHMCIACWITKAKNTYTQVV